MNTQEERTERTLHTQFASNNGAGPPASIPCSCRASPDRPSATIVAWVSFFFVARSCCCATFSASFCSRAWVSPFETKPPSLACGSPRPPVSVMPPPEEELTPEAAVARAPRHPRATRNLRRDRRASGVTRPHAHAFSIFHCVTSHRPAGPQPSLTFRQRVCGWLH
jgi:hypothetical protein